MSYKTILVHLDGNAAGMDVLRVAATLAMRFDAHLAAVYGAEQPAIAISAMDPAAGELLRYQIEWEESSQRAVKAQVVAAEKAHGLAIEWRVIKENLIQNLALHARHADLLVMGQDDPANVSIMRPMRVSAVAMRAGRPVLAVPYAGRFGDCGNSVLLAWNGSRESARAVADALPLLQSARRVNLVAFNPAGNERLGELPGADIAQWLARHGVHAVVETRQSSDADVGNQMLSQAADLGADLIVMGAYGHARATEFIVGGVTRTLLQSMTVPVLMSH